MTSADRRLKWYERGATTVFACRHDTRFSYCLHVPASFDAGSSDHALIVAVHGSSRTATEFRDSFAAFAEAHRCVVLAPLFSVGVMGDDNGEGFKYLVERTIRYDQVLLHMAAEAACRRTRTTASCGGREWGSIRSAPRWRTMREWTACSDRPTWPVPDAS